MENEFKIIEMKTSQTLLGVLGGMTIGTVLGVLFAPDKGSETRKKILKKSTDAANDLKKIVVSIWHPFSGKENSTLKYENESIKGMSDIHIQNIKSINKNLGN
jgi:gas vesicle protein